MNKIKSFLINILIKIGDWLDGDGRSDEQIVRDLKKYHNEIYGKHNK